LPGRMLKFFAVPRCCEKKFVWTLATSSGSGSGAKAPPLAARPVCNGLGQLLGDQLGVHHTLSSVIKLGIHHPKKKGRKTEFLPVFFWVSQTCHNALSTRHPRGGVVVGFDFSVKMCQKHPALLDYPPRPITPQRLNNHESCLGPHMGIHCEVRTFPTLRA